MNAADIRRSFLRYFEERGHQIVASSPLIPRNDPTLFFTNAGMVQFKGVFTGEETRPYSRATTCQKVMRASGKHNDLENVGFTPRHHTFFEMLGNFSFGDYFKQDAIAYAWDLLTNVYGIDPAKLWVTVFREDDEAAAIWIDGMGLPPWKVVRMDEADNFWSMGDTGPCGPCSEIHIDKAFGLGPERVGPDKDPDRFLEIWNLVFMQFERQPDGSMISLPRPSIDTGMGLERVTGVLQGVTSNYDTDLFLPIIHRGAELAGIHYGQDPALDTSLRVVADHSRAAAFLIADGIVPSNEGRGYVLRRIMRRAIRHGVKLGLTRPFFHETVAVVVKEMADAFPELGTRAETLDTIVRSEEERFRLTLDNGLRLFRTHAANARAGGGAVIGGEVVFKLYDTFGFPVDLTQVIAAEEGLDVDLAGFQKEMDAQRERARASWAGSGEVGVSAALRQLADAVGHTTFTGYQRMEGESVVRALVVGGASVPSFTGPGRVEVVVEETPFYAESGGQIGDQGTLALPDRSSGPEGHHPVTDAQKPVEGLIVHTVELRAGEIAVGDRVHLTVDGARRAATRRNHTATHLLHAALKEVLGTHVAQRGSLVGPDRLRFDFTHFQPMNPAQIKAVEDRVNQAILENIALDIGESSLDEAMKAGVVALFGEKYGERVRVVQVPGVSAELCGGTHVVRTGDIGVFKIQSEAGIAAGVRRVEAQTGAGVVELLRQQDAWLQAAAELLRAQPADLVARLSKVLEQVKAQEGEIRKLKAAMVEGGGPGGPTTLEIGGVKVMVMATQADSPEVLREQADRLKDKLGSGIVVLGSDQGGKATLLVAVTRDLSGRFPAGQIIKPLAEKVGGRGGGRPEMAQAGGPNAAALAEALGSVEAVLSQMGASQA